MISVRTDLAIEAKKAYTEENKRELDGVKVDEEMEGEIKITTVTIESDEAGRELGKDVYKRQDACRYCNNSIIIWTSSCFK